MKSLLIFVSLLGFAELAHACLVTKTLTEEQMAKADVVFEGQAVSVSTPKCAGTSCNGTKKGSSGKIVGSRLVTFEIDKVIKGKILGDKVEVYWTNGSFGEIDTFQEFRSRYGNRNRVGIITHETINKSIRCKMVAAVTGLGQPTTVERCETGLPLPFVPVAGSMTDKPWILVEPCSKPFIKPLEN